MAAEPNIDKNGVPFCTDEKCPEYDGKRCRLTGFRPDAICEPAVIELARRAPIPGPAPEVRAQVLEEAARAVEDTDVVEARGGMNSYYAQLGDAKATLAEAAKAVRALKSAAPSSQDQGLVGELVGMLVAEHAINGGPAAARPCAGNDCAVCALITRAREKGGG